MKPWTDDSPRFAERVARWLLGIHAGLGDAAKAVLVARQAEVRRPANWLVPGLGFAYALALLLYHRFAFDGNDAGLSMIFRIFVFDYTLFLFAGISGWNMARKWRANADQVEELSLTPLPPTSVAALMAAGGSALWLRAFVALAVVDLFSGYFDAQYIVDALGELRRAPAAGMVHAALGIVSMVAAPFLLQWFHFESARLAHWMFVSHALPRISLVRAGIVNFVGMSMIVVVLSGIGSIVTMLALSLLMLLDSAVGVRGPTFVAGTHTGWSVAALPGLLAVIALKRVATNLYARSFVKTWLLYQWWGAGETRQPSNYPASFHRALAYWTTHFASQEEQLADVPERRRHATRRLAAMKRHFAEVGEAAGLPPSIGDRNSGSPARSPDPRSGPSRGPESAGASERSSGSP